MKILILAESFLNGGMETHIKTYIKNMQNYEFYLVVSDFNDCVENRKYFKKIYINNFKNEKLGSLLLNIQKIIFNNNIDIIHSHTVETYVIASILAYRMKKIYMITIHGPFSFYVVKNQFNKIYRNKIFNYAHKVYVVSNELNSLFKTLNIESTVLNNCVDLKEYFYKEVSKNSRKWALISRLDNDKIDGIINTLEYINNTRIKELFIFGEGNGINKIYEYIQNNELSFNVKLLGNSYDIASELEKYNFEGVFAMGRAALESMAKGYPVVLIGYDCVKGLVNINNIDSISYTNFSGRGIINISKYELNNQLDDSVLNRNFYDLHSYLKINFNIENNINKYIKDIKNEFISSTLTDLYFLNNILLANFDSSLDELIIKGIL